MERSPAASWTWAKAGVARSTALTATGASSRVSEHPVRHRLRKCATYPRVRRCATTAQDGRGVVVLLDARSRDAFLAGHVPRRPERAPRSGCRGGRDPRAWRNVFAPYLRRNSPLQPTPTRAIMVAWAFLIRLRVGAAEAPVRHCAQGTVSQSEKVTMSQFFWSLIGAPKPRAKPTRPSPEGLNYRSSDVQGQI